MRRTSKSARLGHQAIAGVALAALLAWVPFGMAAQAPAYADEPEAQTAADEGLVAEDDVTFDDVAPEEEALATSEGDALLADEGTGATDEADPLAGTDGTLADGTDVAPLPDAAALSDLDAALASGDPIAQVQALGIVTDPSQVEGYDPAADEDPAEYEELAASDDGEISAQSSDSVRVGDWSYHESKDDSGATVYVIDGYYGSATSVTLPATLGGKQMYGVLFGSSGLPKTVTSVTIPASIKEICASAFYNTKVASVTFAANSQLTSIGSCAFAETPITELTLPAHVKTLGYEAFNNSSLTKLTLSTDLEPVVSTKTVTSGKDTFKVTTHMSPLCGCTNVTVVVPSGCKNYRVEGGALLSKDGTILYAQLSDLGGGTYTVPSSVKIIGSYAMCNNTTFSQIVLPQGLTTMEQYCLYGTSITSLDMPDSVTHVQGYICGYCTRLTSVRISNNLEELGEKAGWECFFGCSSLTSVTLGSKLRVIGNACFSETKLTSVNLPASVEQLNYGAFGNIPTLKSVTGGSGLRYIYRLAFYNTGLTSFPFGKNLRFVSNEAFEKCTFTPKYPSYMDEQSDGYYSNASALVVRGEKSYSLAWQVLTLVNQERAKEGLSALTMDADLLDAAMQRAAETSICFDHTRPTGWTCYTACSKMTAENIASGSSTAQAVMNQWMNSPGHRANILKSGIKSIGIGCVKVSGQYFWVQCFGTSAATTTSKPADVSNTLMKVYVTADGLKAFGSSFEIIPVTSDGASVMNATAVLKTGTPQRYALCTYPWGDGKGALTRIDDSCVKWSLSGTGAKLGTSTPTLTVTGVGTFTLTASAGGGDVKQTLTKTVHTVSFNTNGGSSVASQIVASGSTPNKPANPTKSGYGFLGWYSDSALTKPYYFTDVVKSNLTVYAKWYQKNTASFKDVSPSEWYASWVTQAAKIGLMHGTEDAYGNYTGYFEPERAITRAEVATVLWRISGKPAASACPLPDVSGHWAQAAVSWCYAKGIVTGYKDGPYKGKFMPDAQVSRQELATMVYRFAKYARIKTDNPPTSNFYSCGDTWAVPDWSRDAMVWCAAANVITGVQGGGAPMLTPEGGATRAMAAKIFVRTQELYLDKAGYAAGDTEAETDADDVTFEDAQAPQVTYGQTEQGLAYALVPEGAVDAQGNAYVFGQAYGELGGRYVGAGVYVTGYTGESAELALPAQIEGVDVVSANLSWKGDAEAGTPDPDGRTRLEGLTLERGCKLASLDASGNLLAGLTLAGDEALGGLDCLRYLDLSSTWVISLDVAGLPALEELGLRGCPLAADALAELAAWRGTTGLAADLTGAGEKSEQAGGASSAAATGGAADAGSAGGATVTPDSAGDAGATFDAVEPSAGDTSADELADASEGAIDGEPASADAADITEKPAGPDNADGLSDLASFDAIAA